MNIDLRYLIERLTSTARAALEGAAGLCLSRTNYEVEFEHWMTRLLDSANGDIPLVLRHLDIQPDRFLNALEISLDTFKTGNGRRPELSPVIEDMCRDAWLISSLTYGHAKIRSGTLLLSALHQRQLRRRIEEIEPKFREVNLEHLARDFPTIVASSPESREVTTLGESTSAVTAQDSGGPTQTPALDKYTQDLTLAASQGHIDPVLGRDKEIRQIIDILTRRRQNNPILTGEAGVGKTAVVEGFALCIVAKEVPPALCNVSLRTLDLGLLQAGAGVRGEFENRLKNVIEEVRNSEPPIILFIDEAHTMIGAGGQEGQGDAANLLKPALARGELRTIAATTWAEYKKYFEKDPALTRRFQVVKVEEPSETSAVAMMRGIAQKLEEHHGVRILAEAIESSVYMSHRYIPARQLPDKSVSVLDTACSRISIGQTGLPAPLQDLQRRVRILQTEQRLLVRETSLGADHEERLHELSDLLTVAQADLEAIELRWTKERDLIASIRSLSDELSILAADTPAAEAEALRSDLDSKKDALAAIQGEHPLAHAEVTAQAIAEVISNWTGIPTGKMVADEIQTVLSLSEHLRKRVIGQDHALDAIARRIRTARANIDNPERPIGVFLLVGPSGVGKTESALALADSLYGGERNVITINMSEYQEAHTVSSLKGSPPGYVGYGEGGVLTEAVRRRPYSVVLLDEVEKAHPDVMELFFQVFDKGTLEDGEGRQIDFKNTVIILTSNVGSDSIMKLSVDPATLPEPDTLTKTIRPELLAAFPAALLGRMVIIPYYPIAGSNLKKIIELQIQAIRERIQKNHGAMFSCDDKFIDEISDRCNETDSGARVIGKILTHSLLPQLSSELLIRMAQGLDTRNIEAYVSEDKSFDFRIS